MDPGTDDSSKTEVNETLSESSSYEYLAVDDKKPSDNLTSPVLEYFVAENELQDAILNSSNMTGSQPAAANVVGKSVFYDCPDIDTAQEVDQFTIFSNVLYFGSAAINLPKSEPEILKHIHELNSSTEHNAGVKVKISIPSSIFGVVQLFSGDEGSDILYSSFDIQYILFYARGTKGSAEEACFAFTWSHGDSKETAIYQCHVFKCNIPEAVNHVSSCFAKAFQRVPLNMARSSTSEKLSITTTDMSGNPISKAIYEFSVSMEIREKVFKNNYANVPRDKENGFKIRANLEKEICVTVKQVASESLPPLVIERCFGVLISIGKIQKQSDLQLLEMTQGSYVKGSTTDFQILASWDPNETKALEFSSSSAPLTLACDLVIRGIAEPVRFVVESQIKIDTSENQPSRFSNSFLFQANRKPLVKKFYIQLKENGENSWILSSIDPFEENLEAMQSSSFNQKFKSFSKMVRSSSSISFDLDDDMTDEPSESIDLEEDEPLASGTGEVSKDCSQDRLDCWTPIIIEWQGGRRPKNLASLIRQGGIPEALRCQLWQKLSDSDKRSDLNDKYRMLIAKETKKSCEETILRDVNRTFPAHEFFRDNGNGQELLYKVAKAYSVYDEEVGYCQGLSFIAATLLLHLPEEEAFSVMVSIMFDYGLRELYKENFENLSLRLFQLNCMIRDQIPELYQHWAQIGIEIHMFASQWFLTLFTARFPLPFVFQVIDFFLLDGIQILIQVAFSLLLIFKKELLTKDFEATLKFIRVTLPKKFRSESQVQKLIRLASECKIKKLKRYEDEYSLKKAENNHEERLNLLNEISQLKKRIQKFESNEKNYEAIIQDYKKIIQRQEQQSEDSSISFQKSEKKFDDGSKSDDSEALRQRIRELESELAQSKLSQVESECLNMKLQHELNTLASTWKTQPASTWKTKWDLLVASNIPNNIPSFQSHIASQFNSLDEPK